MEDLQFLVIARAMMIGMPSSIAYSLRLYTVQYKLLANTVLLLSLPSLNTRTGLSTALACEPCGYFLHPVGP
jgi:peptidoglycan biosynthesis protein MviN/MurJ (putative lipid II flippase)